jgi:hypothetical protein
LLFELVVQSKLKELLFRPAIFGALRIFQVSKQNTEFDQVWAPSSVKSRRRIGLSVEKSEFFLESVSNDQKKRDFMRP